MNVDIFIPARLGSNRLPKKHLKKIKDKPLLKHLIDRLKQTDKVRNIVVCTTNLKSDEPLIEFLKQEKISYFKGSEKDILVRFLDAAHYFNTDIIIDVEGDKIYTDFKFIEKIISILENSDVDFVIGNNSTEKFDPTLGIHGFIPMGVKTSALEKLCELKKTDNTETGYKEFFTSSNQFKGKFLIPEIHELPKNLRLAIDYQEDFDLAKKIFEEIGSTFHYQDIIRLLKKKPELLKITDSLITQWKKEYDKKITDHSLKNIR